MSFFAITSNHPRHVQFLETLYEQLKIPVVIVVDKGPISQKEADFFEADLSLLRQPNILRCNLKQLHSNFVLQTLKKLDPKAGFVFGAPLLKESIFSIPEYGCVNIHTGPVDHYRGVDSAYWAIQDERLDLIGATLHYIDKSIDGGDTIEIGNVSCDIYDTPDTLFFKSCKSGFSLLRDNLYDIVNNSVSTIKLDKLGKLYQNKDMNDDVVRSIHEKLPRLLREYKWK